MATQKDRATQRRAHIESGERQRMTRKDTLSLSISLLALLVSSVTAYYNLLRVRHDFSLVMGEDFDGGAVFEDSGLISFNTKADLVFVNKGTRPVAILDLKLNLYQFASVPKEREDCEFRQGTF